MAHYPAWYQKCALGTVVTVQEAAQLGGDPECRYYVRFRVVAKEDLNAVCIAQDTHEGVLRTQGCMSDHNSLRYDTLVPRGCSVLEGVYADDHLLLGLVPWKDANSHIGPYADALTESRASYNIAGPPLSQSAAFAFESTFRAWGWGFVTPRELLE